MPNDRDYDNIDEYDRDMDRPLRTRSYTIKNQRWEAPLSDYEWSPILKSFIQRFENGWPLRDLIGSADVC